MRRRDHRDAPAGIVVPDGRGDARTPRCRSKAEELHEAEQLGVFGVPTFVIAGEIFWGGDRLWMVREKLAAA